MKKACTIILWIALLWGCAAAEEAVNGIRISTDIVSSRGLVTVYWQDSAEAAPYTVLYRYATETLDPQTEYMEENIENQTSTLRFLAPGADYIITVINSLGDSGEALISLPAPPPFADGKLTADRLGLALLPCRRPADSSSDRDISHSVRFEAEEISRTLDDTDCGLRVTLSYPELALDREYQTILVFRAPGGFACVYNLGNVVYRTMKTPQMQVQFSPFCATRWAWFPRASTP